VHGRAKIDRLIPAEQSSIVKAKEKALRHVLELYKNLQSMRATESQSSIGDESATSSMLCAKRRRVIPPSLNTKHWLELHAKGEEFLCRSWITIIWASHKSVGNDIREYAD